MNAANARRRLSGTLGLRTTLCVLAVAGVLETMARAEETCHEMLVAPGDAKHTRNSEADIVPLNCSYPSCTFVGDKVLITYDVPAGVCALKLRVLPLAWFHGDETPSSRSGGSDEAAAHMPRAPRIEDDQSAE